MSETEIIATAWRKQFPILKKYTATRLYMKADFMVIGMQITASRYGGNYRIYLECFPLWLDEDLVCIDPSILYEMKGPKNRQFFIGYKLHDYWFETAVSCAKAQFGKLLDKEISLNDLMTFIDYYSSTVGHNPVDRTHIFPLKLAIALYFEDSAMKNIVMDEIERECKHWNKEHFYEWYHKTVEQWKIELYEQFSCREKFLERITVNSLSPKIATLNEAHVIYDLVGNSIFLKNGTILDRILASISKWFHHR